MLGGLGGDEFRLGGRTPAVRLGAKVLDFRDGWIRTQEGGDICGKCGGGETIDHAMAFVSPCVGERGEGELGGEECAEKGREAKILHARKYS